MVSAPSAWLLPSVTVAPASTLVLVETAEPVPASVCVEPPKRSRATLMVPLLLSVGPLKRKAEAASPPVSVPSSVSVPASVPVCAAGTLSAPPLLTFVVPAVSVRPAVRESVRPVWTVREATAASAAEMVGSLTTPAEGMTAMSEAVGTTPVSQLAPLCQSASALPFQLKTGDASTRQGENSEVLGASPVRVAVTTWPTIDAVGNVTLNGARPLPSVLMFVKPRWVCPSPLPDWSHAGLE